MFDFPAAHSMDTHWFAIDNDGNVGVFWSDEGGAIPDPDDPQDPAANSSIIHLYDFTEELAKYTEGVIKVNADGKTFADEANLNYFEEQKAYSGKWYDLLLVLTSEYVIEKLKNENSVIGHFSGKPVVIYIQECSDRTIQNLLKSGEIIGAKDFELQGNPSVLGLFYYRHCWGNTIAYPYDLEGVPETPIKVQQLPKQLQDFVSLTKYKFSFTSTPKIQPIEHSDRYEYWYDGYSIEGWEDTNGKIHYWGEEDEEE